MSGPTPRTVSAAPDPHPQPPLPDDPTMPFAWWYPMLAGALIGLVLRLAFSGGPGQRYATMLGAFIYLAPVACGAVTVYLAERRRPHSVAYWFWAPWLSTTLMVAGSLLILIEGWICALLILPMFGLMGSVGGLLMGLVCRLTRRPRRTLYGVVALPLALGAIEPALPTPEARDTSTASILIAAPPQAVWHALNTATAIAPQELGDAWAWRIGVPPPQEGLTRDTPEGRVRDVRWAKGVHFQEHITSWEPGRRLAWRYAFTPDSFPAGALDDHVVIGGHYFELGETAYTLTARDGGTELRIDVDWRVRTAFNWYAAPLARWLLGDFAGHILAFYKARSERAVLAAQ